MEVAFASVEWRLHLHTFPCIVLACTDSTRQCVSKHELHELGLAHVATLAL